MSGKCPSITQAGQQLFCGASEEEGDGSGARQEKQLHEAVQHHHHGSGQKWFSMFFCFPLLKSGGL